MKPIMTKKKAVQGISLIEIGMVIAVLAIISAFAMVSFGNTGEVRDASMVQSAQASLQSIISQGAVRMDTKPYDLDAAMVLTAIRANIGERGTVNQGVTFTSPGPHSYTMTIRGSQRSATFDVSTTGDVRLRSPLNNFPHYQVDANGIIQKR
jgi:type II secretory pathway pseudopilin PulG